MVRLMTFGSTLQKIPLEILPKLLRRFVTTTLLRTLRRTRRCPEHPITHQQCDDQ